mmetsp:Transcript_36528/g.53588  ORF Transcript_36528/g.53588 Transcript_36528/m.53588 type:complete len:641 (+) Transcript_36528:187-2109(+)
MRYQHLMFLFSSQMILFATSTAAAFMHVGIASAANTNPIHAGGASLHPSNGNIPVTTPNDRIASSMFGLRRTPVMSLQQKKQRIQYSSTVAMMRVNGGYIDDEGGVNGDEMGKEEREQDKPNTQNDAKRENMSPERRAEEMNRFYRDVPAVPHCELPRRFGEFEEEYTPEHGIVMVDNFCPYHGEYIAHMAREAYGVGVVNSLSEYLVGFLYNVRNETRHFSDRMPSLENVEEVMRWRDLIPFEIVAIYCESDSGLGEAEKLGLALGLYPDGCHDGYNEGRRDKFIMNQILSEEGMDTVRQTLCSSLEDAMTFASEELGIPSSIEENSSSSSLTSFPKDKKICVVKPTRGVASDNVHLCRSLSEVESAFKSIHGTPMFATTRNERNEQVLLQEYAKGTEYAVDIVTKNGQHKVAALWRYDKRPVNGAPVVYHGTELQPIDNTFTGDPRPENEERLLACDTAMRALDALGVRWGMSHNEVMVDSSQPNKMTAKLIEINCRQHNTDFAPLTSACVGYNALDMVLAAYLGDLDDLPPETLHLRLDWDSLPVLPTTQLNGAVVHLVCHVKGKVVELKHIEEIQALKSVVAMEIYPGFLEGEYVKPTLDIRSDAGWLHLINDDEKQFRSDYDRIVDLMPEMFVVD